MKTLAVTVIMFVSVSAFAQGVPVIDASNLAQAVQQVAAWEKQYAQMQQQISSLQSQLQSITGTRNLGTILNDPSLQQYLPNNWQSLLGSSNLSGTASDIYNQNKKYDACVSLIGDAKTICQGVAAKPSQDQGAAEDAYVKAQQQMKQIQSLMAQINQTNDPKAIAELQARISAEQAMILNTQNELLLYKMAAAAEAKIQDQQQNELNAKEADKRGWPQATSAE